MVEVWDGASWSVSSTPNELYGALSGVSCVSAATCVAIGAYYNGSVNQTLVLSGTMRARVPTSKSECKGGAWRNLVDQQR